MRPAWLSRLQPADRVPAGQALALALALCLAALTVRAAVEPWLQGAVPFATFFVALLFATLYGGFWGGVGSLVVSSATVAFLFLEPTWSPQLTDRSAAALLLYLATGSVLVTATLEFRRALVRFGDEEAQLRLVNRELHHRVRNLMTIVQAITIQTLRQTADPSDAARAVEGRLAALAANIAFLNPSSVPPPRFGDLVDNCVRPLCPAPDRLQVSGDDVIVPAVAVVGITLVLHELSTNAVKHGAWSNGMGRVSIRCNGGTGLQLTWEETNGPAIARPPARLGFGSRLLQSALPAAAVTTQFLPTGLRFDMEWDPRRQ